LALRLEDMGFGIAEIVRRHAGRRVHGQDAAQRGHALFHAVEGEVDRGGPRVRRRRSDAGRAGEVRVGEQPVAQPRVGHDADDAVDLVGRELDTAGEAAIEIARAQPDGLGDILQLAVLLLHQDLAQERCEPRAVREGHGAAAPAHDISTNSYVCVAPILCQDRIDNRL